MIQIDVGGILFLLYFFNFSFFDLPTSDFSVSCMHLNSIYTAQKTKFLPTPSLHIEQSPFTNGNKILPYFLFTINYFCFGLSQDLFIFLSIFLWGLSIGVLFPALDLLFNSTIDSVIWDFQYAVFMNSQSQTPL